MCLPKYDRRDLHNDAEYCSRAGFGQYHCPNSLADFRWRPGTMADMEAGLVKEAIEAARRALREMEASEVPAKLRRVVASSARNLPRPLESGLMDAIDEYEWLRDKALEKLPEDVAGPPRWYLERPDLWEEDLAAAATERAAGSEQRQVDKLTQEVLDLIEQRDQAREKAKALRAVLELERAEHRDVVTSLKQGRKVPVRPLADDRRQVEGLEAENQRLERLVVGQQTRLDKTRAELLRSRRATAPNDDSANVRSNDPVSLARQLDRFAAAALPDAVVIHTTSTLGSPPVADVLSLPPGIAPDAPSAIDYLLTRVEPMWVIVDGYNVSYHLDAAGFSTPAARTKVANGLTRLRARATGKIRVTIVWDSSEQATEGPAVAGIERKFVPDADEEVRRLSHEANGLVVVISTDREVHAGVASGTLVLWSEAFADWMKSH